MGFRLRPISISVLILAASFIIGIVVPSDAQIRQPEKERILKPSGIELDRKPDRIEGLKLSQTNLPNTLLIGDFTLAVEAYSEQGKSDIAKKQVTGVSGTAWLSFACTDGLTLTPVWPIDSIIVIPKGYSRIKSTFEIVSNVTNSRTQISLQEASLIRSDAKVGQRLELELAVEKSDAQSILRAKEDLIGKLKLKEKKGDILVRFDKVTITEVVGKKDVGRITQGTAVYPTEPPYPKIIKLSVQGFTALIGVLTLTPRGATANIVLQFPGSVGSADTCEPASLHLGTASITPNCEFYVEKPGDPFGPWIIGDTGMIASGTGYIADFSSSQSPPAKVATWKGVLLNSGTASGAGTIPEPSNTGYLAANYSFTNATVTGSGFAGQLVFSGNYNFQTVNPIGYIITMQAATLNVSDSKIASGQLGTGSVAPPTIAICKERSPRNQIRASFSLLTVQSDLDLSGEVKFDSGIRISYGELTHVGDEVVAWGLEVKAGFLYLPAGPMSTFSPDTGGGFLSFFLNASMATAVADMESKGMSGVAIGGVNMDDIAIYSPDRLGGTTNPIRLHSVDGWLRVGHRGIDADLNVYEWNKKEPLGDKTRHGYVGGEPFDATLNPSQKERKTLFQFATSAAYDSRIDGNINIPEPCNITALEFADMEATSTANLVGGNVVLPVGGVTLDYWKLSLVPTGDPSQAGVVSVRTGRLIFTAAGISEPVHFAQPFKLTWGEMLADGNLSELFFDYNSYGQRFDKLNFSPHHVALSKYVPGATDGYLAVCGSIYFNFFGSGFVNIKDARYDTSAAAPYYSRYVTVPKTGEASCPPTDLHLQGEWDDASGDDLATLDFPDAQMQYNETIQHGFIGTGSASVSFIHSDGLDATIEIHGDAIDICMTATTTHDIDFGLFSRLGGINQVSGCIRIEGPTLERMVIGGYLESSSSAGFDILEPKTGYVVEVVFSVTPNYCTFYASGDMLLAVAGSAVDVSGSVYLKVDFTRSSAEGDVNARINCNSVLAGLEGSGQITWYVDPSTQYLQGRVSMTVCSWSGGAGLEGGIFIGHNVPKAKAWVFQTISGRFGVSQEQLPDTLTGLYGYGQISFGVNWYIFGGGIELYAGMGAFSVTPPGLGSAWADLAGVGLPYVLGSGGIYVHGEILGGLVSASAWASLTMGGPIPITFEGSFGLEACVLWVFCASVEITAGLGSSGFYMF